MIAKRLLLSIGVLLSTTAQAHVSAAHGLAHTVEHFWLLVALAPLLLLVRPLAVRLVRQRQR